MERALERIFNFSLFFGFVQCIFFLLEYGFLIPVGTILSIVVFGTFVLMPKRFLSRIGSAFLVAGLLFYGGMFVIPFLALSYAPFIGLFLLVFGISSFLMIGTSYIFQSMGDKSRRLSSIVIVLFSLVFLTFNVLDSSSLVSASNGGRVQLTEAELQELTEKIQRDYPDLFFRNSTNGSESYTNYILSIRPFVLESCKKQFISIQKEERCTNISMYSLDNRIASKRKEIIYAEVERTKKTADCLSLPAFEEIECIKRYAVTISDCELLPLEVNPAILGDDRTVCITNLAVKNRDKSMCEVLSTKKVPSGYSQQQRCLLYFEPK